MKTELAIFDLDGTLLDTIADLGNAVNHQLELYGYPTHEIGEYRKMVGHGMRNLCKNALPETVDEKFLDEFVPQFIEWYKDHISVCTRPYPGMVELMKRLSASGMKLAVASNKVQAGTERLVSEFFSEVDFVEVMGNSPIYPLKPEAAVVNHLLSKSGVAPDSAVMVGDSGTDIRTARNAGIRCYAVSWGFRPKSDLAEADAIADTALELEALLLS